MAVVSPIVFFERMGKDDVVVDFDFGGDLRSPWRFTVEDWLRDCELAAKVQKGLGDRIQWVALWPPPDEKRPLCVRVVDTRLEVWWAEGKVPPGWSVVAGLWLTFGESDVHELEIRGGALAGDPVLMRGKKVF